MSPRAQSQWDGFFFGVLAATFGWWGIGLIANHDWMGFLPFVVACAFTLWHIKLAKINE